MTRRSLLALLSLLALSIATALLLTPRETRAQTRALASDTSTPALSSGARP